MNESNALGNPDLLFLGQLADGATLARVGMELQLAALLEMISNQTDWIIYQYKTTF